MVATVERYWSQFDGQLGLKGIDPMDMPFDRFLNAAYAWMTENMDEAQLAKFENQLWLPIKGKEIPKESPWSAENEKKAFAQFSSAING